MAGPRHASMVIHLAIAYLEIGQQEKARQLLEEVIERANSDEPQINVFAAHYYSHIGDNDTAFEWLEKSFQKREVDLIWLPADPNLQKLKNDPRYDDLIRRVGFPD